MSKVHLCYPNSFHSITVRCILENGNFIEDTAYFYVKSNINEKDSIDIRLFKDFWDLDITSDCTYGNNELMIGYSFRCHYCRTRKSRDISWGKNKKISFYPDIMADFYDTISCCEKSCFIITINPNPYYIEFDFESKQPYRDPNAPILAGIFGLFAGAATALTFDVAGIPLVEMAALGATTGLTPIAAGVLTLGGSGTISSYFSTLSNDGNLCINLPTINVGNSQGRALNEIGVPIYLTESDYQQIATNTSKSDLINKFNNHPITSLIAQYPGLFKKT